MHTQLLRTVSVAVLAALATVAAWSAGAAEALSNTTLLLSWPALLYLLRISISAPPKCGG